MPRLFAPGPLARNWQGFFGVAANILSPAAWRRSRKSNSFRGLRLVRAVLGAIGRVSESTCGHCAALAFLRPPRFPRTRTERDLLSHGHPIRVGGRHGDVAMWQWGCGPRVLLVHGWGGHAARLRHFVVPLVRAGFGVVSFDAPGHGFSHGSLASLPDFIDAVRLASRITDPVALIGHSMGAAACALALRDGLDAQAAVLLSPPEDPERYALRFARYLRLSAVATASMTDRLQERYGVRLRDLRLAVKGPAVPILVFHDARDARVPVGDSKAIAASWPCMRLVVTRGLGHHRILRDRTVVSQAVSFLEETIGSAAAMARIRIPSSAEAWSGSARFPTRHGRASQLRTAVGG